MLGLTVLAIGCSGPALGDIVSQELTLSVTGFSSAPDVAAVGAAQAGLGVTRAFVSMSALSLVPCAEGAREIVLPSRGYDLLSDPPASEVVTTAVSDYCSLRLDVDPVSQNASEGVPDGASLYVEAEDAAGTAVTFESESSASLLFELDAGASFGTEPVLLGFDLSAWLAGLPLPKDMVADEAKKLDAQLLDSAALYVDTNANQALDADELTPVARAMPSR